MIDQSLIDWLEQLFLRCLFKEGDKETQRVQIDYTWSKKGRLGEEEISLNILKLHENLASIEEAIGKIPKDLKENLQVANFYVNAMKDVKLMCSSAVKSIKSDKKEEDKLDILKKCYIVLWKVLKTMEIRYPNYLLVDRLTEMGCTIKDPKELMKKECLIYHEGGSHYQVSTGRITNLEISDEGYFIKLYTDIPTLRGDKLESIVYENNEKEFLAITEINGKKEHLKISFQFLS